MLHECLQCICCLLNAYAAWPEQILALMALRARGKLLQRSMAIISHNLRLLSAFFGAHQGAATWVPPKAGPIAFPAFHLGTSSLTMSLSVQRHGTRALLNMQLQHATLQQSSSAQSHHSLGAASPDTFSVCIS